MKSTDHTWFAAPPPVAVGAHPSVFAPAYAAGTVSPLRTVGTRAYGSPATLHAAATPADADSQIAAVPRPTLAAILATLHLRAAVIDSGTFHDKVLSARRRVAGSAPLPPASPAPPLAASAGLPLSCDHRLQRSNVHRLFGHNVLQLSVLFLQPTQPLRLTHFHAPNLLFHR